MKKNLKIVNITNLAFTLVELLGVIILLGVIALITFPIIDKSIKNSKQEALNRTIENIKEAAYNYSVANDIGVSTTYRILQLSELIYSGFLKENIINPVTNEQLQGCVLYKWNNANNQYIFEYSEECETMDTEPVVDIIYDNNLINENGWANKDLAITISGNGEVKYCISDKECEPNELIEVGNNTKFVTNEGINYVCGSINNSLGIDKKCVTIKLDKTAPVDFQLDIVGTKGENGWFVSDVKITNVDGYDDLSGIATATSNISLIDYNTSGQDVIITLTDLAGNIATFTKMIKVDKESLQGTSLLLNGTTSRIDIILGTRN